jgi:phosphoenolpyruvate---glycerone phosphotransferase subunit DhaL
MVETIDGAALQSALERVAGRMVELRDWLNELDAAMGDGDTGITVAKGGHALREYMAANPPGDDLGKWLAAAGMALNRVAPSTLGTLLSTALLRAGREARGVAQLEPALLAKMVQAANAGMQERGKAKPGDKTIIDALHPAAETFATAIGGGQSLEAAGMAMLQAARAGRDAAIPLRSRIGRASWVGERTENQPDPGSVLCVQVIETIMNVDYSAPGSATMRAA